MMNLKCNFIVQLEYSFQTTNHLIFAMEFCSGGDLFTKL